MTTEDWDTYFDRLWKHRVRAEKEWRRVAGLRYWRDKTIDDFIAGYRVWGGVLLPWWT